MKQLFVIMCRDVPCRFNHFSIDRCIDISGNFFENITYFNDYRLAADRLQLIIEQINDLKFVYDYLSEYTRPTVSDFYIAEVSFNRYMPVAGNTISDKFDSVKYVVGDKVIFVNSGTVYVGKIEAVHAYSIDDLPKNNNYTYDILATDRIELSKFTKTIQGEYQPTPITDTEVIFESVLEDVIIGLF